MLISLCIIVKNELIGCRTDIPKIPFNEFDEIYAVDGGSTDGTIEYLQSMGITVYIQPKPGLNAAYVYANTLSTSDAVVSFFPKGTIPLSDLLKFRPLLEAGNEIVIASRQIKGSRNEEDDHFFKIRKWGVSLLGQIVALIWMHEGYLVRDVLHGIKGWNKDSFNRMNLLNHGLSIDLEMVVRSYKLKMTRTEFPTHETKRSYGETNFKLIPTSKKLFLYLISELFRK
jgi:glycosyltransferase involved in cell wall biosynthesis